MRTINSNKPKYFVGRRVIMKREFKSGNNYLFIGETGEIIGINKHTLPDLGLFDIDVLDIKFTSCIVSWAEQIAEEYLDLL